MGTFGAIPSGVSLAIESGQEAVTVDVDGTTMSFVPDSMRHPPQVWWTQLGSFIESEGLVAAKHASAHASARDRSKKLNRLRFTDYLPGAKVLVWNSHKTVFIYIKQGLGKREASEAVRAALQAAGRPKLSPVHASLISLGVAGGLHLPLWVAHWPLPKGAVATAGGSLAVAAVFGASSLVFQWPSHPDHVPVGASLSPVTAQPAPPFVLPVPQPSRVRASALPSVFVQVTPRPIPTGTRTAPHPKPTRSADPAPDPAPDPLPSLTPAPLPSSQVPAPLPSGVTDTPTPWWLPLIFPTGQW